MRYPVSSKPRISNFFGIVETDLLLAVVSVFPLASSRVHPMLEAAAGLGTCHIAKVQVLTMPMCAHVLPL